MCLLLCLRYSFIRRLFLSPRPQTFASFSLSHLFFCSVSQTVDMGMQQLFTKKTTITSSRLLNHVCGDASSRNPLEPGVGAGRPPLHPRRAGVSVRHDRAVIEAGQQVCDGELAAARAYQSQLYQDSYANMAVPEKCLRDRHVRVGGGDDE
ncbi:hypothetical protein STCU_10045 [Strigomonas culicis]|uniref:Uncharacterized protein n=1 Tax=Strigomonas culicis TaxID=28005 RepID=S9UUY5_9TRYP|nr:hypothetical protein STCU_10045 [Strigomonas culicis]|eukprot:EPY18336.1 hypothetical protein STCU_10045 [Strigomonas culicis]